MKKTILFATLLSISMLQANPAENFQALQAPQPTALSLNAHASLEENVIRDTLFYADISIPTLPVPLLGVGMRAQRDFIGLDASVKAFVFHKALVRENVSFLIYPKPNLSSQWYLGAGASAVQPFTLHSIFGPSLVIGKSFTKNKNETQFFQASFDYYVTDDEHHYDLIDLGPFAILTYGFGF